MQLGREEMMIRSPRDNRPRELLREESQRKRAAAHPGRANLPLALCLSVCLSWESSVQSRCLSTPRNAINYELIVSISSIRAVVASLKARYPSSCPKSFVFIT